jgi:hypothetical protein
MSDEFDELQLQTAVCDGPQRDRGSRGGPLSRIPELIADTFRCATSPLRARLLECLLQPVGPLGLVAIAAGAFGDFLRRGGYRKLAISAEDAARISADQMLELARYVEQCSPETFERIGTLLAQTPVGIAGVGGSVLLVALRAWRRQGPARES